MPTKPEIKTFFTEQEIENQSFDTDFGVNVVEPLEYDGVNLQRAISTNVSLQIEYDGNSNPIYLGIATPGTATSASLWQIRKLTFDGNNNVTAIKYASGSSSFNQKWDDRGGLSYS